MNLSALVNESDLNRNSSYHQYFHAIDQQYQEANETILFITNQTNTIQSTLFEFSNVVLKSNQTTNGANNSTVVYFIITVCQYAYVYYTPLLTVTGTIGNIISVLVFFRTKLKKLSSSYYLSALCISDTGFLLINFILWLNIFNINIYSQNICCQLFTFLSGFCSALSVWFVVAFTIERFIAVIYPLKRQTMCTVNRAKSVLIGLLIVSAFHSLPLIVLWAPDFATNERLVCEIKNGYEVYMKYYNFYDTTLSFVLPLTTIIILNSITAYTVWELADVRRTMTNHKRRCFTHSPDLQPDRQQSLRPLSTRREEIHSDYTQMLSNDFHARHLNESRGRVRQTCIKSNRQALSSSLQMKVTKMLLFVSSIFVLLNLPSYVFRVLLFLMDDFDDPSYIMAGQYVAQQFFVTNFGINFVLYCMSGQNFRKETINMFRQQSNKKNDLVGGTQVTILELVNSNNGPNRIRTTMLVPDNGTTCTDVYEMQTFTPSTTII